MRCGYSFVHQSLDLKVFPPDIPAEVSRSVNKIIISDNTRLIPVRNAPKDESPIIHLLFALRVEGINLAILSAALRKIPASEIRAAVVEHPSSRYVRILGFLWEAFNNCELEDVNPAGPRVDLFDSSQYIVGTPVCNNKWRVVFNGLGNLDYCPIVRKTPQIIQALTDQPLKRARDWFKTIGELNAERAMQWAYLHETKGTYALERESEPSGDRRARFLSLLGKAFLQTPLTEDLLCDYQSDIVNNPYFLEFSIRQKQNWLGTGNPRNERSSMSVRYVPPSPDLLAKLMPAWLSMANSLPKTVAPIVAAACTSFGFVYLHPFLDGNGRLSRFLVHQQLAQSGELEPGMLLPISVAMQKNELSYLNALTVFSKPAREFWKVVYTGSNPEFDCDFMGDDALYRFWDATSQAEFLFEMTRQALDVHLIEEVHFLNNFDAISKKVAEEYDLEQIVLFKLVSLCLERNGKFSKRIREKFAERVGFPSVYDRIEELTQKALLDQDLDDFD